MGNRLPASYWIERNQAMKKGDLKPKELVKESGDYLKSLGFVYNPVLGWVKPEELEEALMEKNQNAVPIRIEDVKGKKRKRINYRFSQYMDKRIKEDYRRDFEREDAESMVESLVDEMDIPF